MSGEIGCGVPGTEHNYTYGVTFCWGCKIRSCTTHTSWIPRHGLPALPYCPSCKEKIDSGQLIVPDAGTPWSNPFQKR